MNYILLNFLVFVPGSLSSTSGSQSNLESSAELTSLSKLAAAVSKLGKQEQDDDRIDLDYFGVFSKFDSDYLAEGEDEERFNSLSPHRPRFVYISNPEVLKDYQKKLGYKLVRSSEPTSLENHDLDKLSVKDILEFLVQVEARLQESEGRTANEHQSLSFSKLEKILKNLRRQNEDKFESVEGLPGASSYISDGKEISQHAIQRETDKSEERVRTTIPLVPSGENRESIAYTPVRHVGRVVEKSRSKELFRPFKRNSLKKRERSEEPISRPKNLFLSKDRFRPKRVTKRVPGFIGTRIPMTGKKTIYED